MSVTPAEVAVASVAGFILSLVWMLYYRRAWLRVKRLNSLMVKPEHIHGRMKDCPACIITSIEKGFKWL